MVNIRRKWTEADRQFLRENYQNMTDKELAGHLNTSVHAVRYQRVELGLKRNFRIWTREKDRFLRNNYVKMTNEELAVELKVSYYSLTFRLYTLRLRRFKEWTPEQEQFLRDNYEVMSNAFLAKKLSRLGLARKREWRWSKKKEDFLKAGYKRLSVSELADECGMPPDYIKNKIVELGLRKEVADDFGDIDSTIGCRFRKLGAKRQRYSKAWTEDKVSFLRNNYVKMTNKELADELGTTLGGVEQKLVRLKLRRPRKDVSEQEQFLRDNYEVMSNAFLAKKLGITDLAVAKKLSRLGLARKRKWKWSKGKEDFLKAGYKRLSVSELAAECGMPPDYIKSELPRPNGRGFLIQ